MRKLKGLYREQSGVAMIMVALCLFIIIGFTAFVVDAGGLYFEKSRLQKSLDAAVLGGAQLLKVSQDDAEAVAFDLTLQNGFGLDTGDVETGDNYIEIYKTVTKELTFARVLGFNDTNVSAMARAEVLNTLIKGDDITPVGIEEGECTVMDEDEEECVEWGFQVGEPYTMHFKPGKSEGEESIKGNFGFLDVESEWKNLREKIENGVTLEVDSVLTKTGFSWGQVSKGFQTRIDNDEGKDHCNSYETADSTCSRVVTVPIVETFQDAEGKSEVKIVGFAAYYISAVINTGNEKRIEGRFIEFVRNGEFGEGENYGISGVKLVN
ncbi:Tad domain-containing protein [Virgibacillus sp. C22-A2]|uniref:Tad domain-containing protein n=1 Tax=Virgibacillus tibetensis TaxID=3042313 RepID=A0ABU6KHT8_9BACI|nr:Tad domain-containing protein [Virgibacillus sp. C22-A2]